MHARLAAALATVVLAASACGGSAAPDVSPDTSPGAAVASPTFAVPTHVPSAVPPATGTRHRLGPVSIVVPRGFAQTSDSGSDSFRLLQFATTDPVAYVELTRTRQAPSADLDDAAKQAAMNSPIQPTRLPDRTVGGQPVYVLAGANEYTAFYYSVGRVVDGALIEVSFSFRNDVPESHRLVDAVLATLEWAS